MEKVNQINNYMRLKGFAHGNSCACPYITSGITATYFLIYSEFSAIHAHFCVNYMAMPRRRTFRLADNPDGHSNRKFRGASHCW
jgi:hypothetical protein